MKLSGPEVPVARAEDRTVPGAAGPLAVRVYTPLDAAGRIARGPGVLSRRRPRRGLDRHARTDRTRLGACGCLSCGIGGVPPRARAPLSRRSRGRPGGRRPHRLARPRVRHRCGATRHLRRLGRGNTGGGGVPGGGTRRRARVSLCNCCCVRSSTTAASPARGASSPAAISSTRPRSIMTCCITRPPGRIPPIRAFRRCAPLTSRVCRGRSSTLPNSIRCATRRRIISSA